MIAAKKMSACGVAIFSVVFAASSIQAKVRPDYLTLGAGMTGIFNSHTVSAYSGEVRFTPWFWQLRPWVHVSLTGDESFQAAAGLAYSLESENSPWSVAAGFGPGYYNARNGKDLGGNFQNMSFLEAAYRFENEQRVSLRLSHLSNGGLRTNNPGTERLTVNYSIPLGR